MRASDRRFVVAGLMLAAGLMVLWAGTAAAVTTAQMCQAAKLKTTGKYAFCRLKADAKAVKTGQPADYTKCVATFTAKFTDAEFAAGGLCPTQGDVVGVEGQVIGDTTAFKLLQARWVDNGDGTVSDTQTGLMWEQKDTNPISIHYKNNTYSWSTSGQVPDGTAFMTFLFSLNYSFSYDGTTMIGCFAGHCDWRLPTNAELQPLLDLTAPGCGSGSPCINAAFGPTVASVYWSSTTYASVPSEAWFVFFDDGTVSPDLKTSSLYVRAVRAGS